MQLNSKRAIIILFLILLLGGFLRFYKLGQQSFIGDEFYGINISYGYFKSGEWKNWDFNENKLTADYYTRAKVYYWQVAQVFKILPTAEASVRIVSVIWGMIGIISVFIISYLVTRNYWIALLAALLISVSVSSLTYDRKLRMYAMFVPVYFWFSYLLFCFIESKPKKGLALIKKISEKTQLNWNFFLPVLFFGSLSFATHILTVNIIPSLFFYFVFMALILYRKKGIMNKYFFFFSLFILLVILSFGTNKIQTAFEFLSLGVNNWNYYKKIFLDYRDLFLAVFFLFMGMRYLITKKEKIGPWIVTSFLTIVFFAMVFWKRETGQQYILFIQPFKVLIMACGIYLTAKIISKKIFSDSKKWFLAFIFLFFGLLINTNFFFLSKESFYKEKEKWVYANYREVYQYFLKHRGGSSVLIVRALPSSSFYLWNNNANLINYDEKKGNELTLEMVLNAQEEYDDVWAFFSTTMYVEKDAQKYIQENFEKVETKYTNDRLGIWRWQRKNGENNISDKVSGGN